MISRSLGGNPLPPTPPSPPWSIKIIYHSNNNHHTFVPFEPFIVLMFPRKERISYFDIKYKRYRSGRTQGFLIASIGVRGLSSSVYQICFNPKFSGPSHFPLPLLDLGLALLHTTPHKANLSSTPRNPATPKQRLEESSEYLHVGRGLAESWHLHLSAACISASSIVLVLSNAHNATKKSLNKLFSPPQRDTLG